MSRPTMASPTRSVPLEQVVVSFLFDGNAVSDHGKAYDRVPWCVYAMYSAQEELYFVILSRAWPETDRWSVCVYRSAPLFGTFT